MHLGLHSAEPREEHPAEAERAESDAGEHDLSAGQIWLIPAIEEVKALFILHGGAIPNQQLSGAFQSRLMPLSTLVYFQYSN